MKKIFTLISMALVAMNINAQDVYDAVVDGKLAPEFAAVAGEDGGVANNASNGRSVITITKGQATCTAVGGTTPAKDETIGGDALQIVPGAALEGMENTYEVAWIGAWNDINWGIKTQEDINFSYVTGTGIPYVQMLCVQNSKDGELIENSYSTDYFYYKPDGSWGIPMSGLYYTLKATATGAFKVKVALDKGIHDTYVVNTSTMKAERVLASGYIDGVNDGEGKKKLLAYDEVEAMNEAMGEDYQYVIGNGEAFWGWLSFDAQEGETYWLFQKDAQIGFGGFEFYEGMTADELNGVKPKPYIYTTRFSTYEDEETGIRTTWNGEKAVGNGKFAATDEEGAPFSDFFQNDGTAMRTSYCLLPEDVLAHSEKSQALTIAFWVRAQEDAVSSNYLMTPLFTAYTAAPSSYGNTWPMMACQYRGGLQVSCSGWSDYTDEQNVAGEIVTKGTNMMLGYYLNEEATREAIDEEGWYHTGDLGTMLPSGHIFIRGRSKNMLLGANGQNVYPEEIEDKLNTMAMVSESIVIQRGEKLVALVHPDQDEVVSFSQEELEHIMEQNRQELNNMLPAYSRISAIELHEEEFAKTPKKSIKRYLYKNN